jgi:hypothetical protein
MSQVQDSSDALAFIKDVFAPIRRAHVGPAFHREEKLMPISMMIVVGRGYPLAKAKSLAELADAPWVYTGA